MGESTKAVSALVFVVSTVVAVVAWATDHPNSATWGVRIGCTTLALLLLGLILYLQFRADVERDFLRPVTGTYFNRDGFCFAFVVASADGIAFMIAYFQSQYDRRSVGQIALRPARGFFMTRSNIDAIAYEIECPPAGFGFARLAIPIPKDLQGKRQSFEVGASVRYPEGKGRRVRFHDGLFLRSNTNFGNSFGTALTIAGAATGSIVMSKPASIKIELPVNVAEDIPGHIEPEIRSLWKLGDLPIDHLS